MTVPALQLGDSVSLDSVLDTSAFFPAPSTYPRSVPLILSVLHLPSCSLALPLFSRALTAVNARVPAEMSSLALPSLAPNPQGQGSQPFTALARPRMLGRKCSSSLLVTIQKNVPGGGKKPAAPIPLNSAPLCNVVADAPPDLTLLHLHPLCQTDKVGQ